ncbi:MAG: hypothetical protein K5929_07405 [Lachnospiraceae bacterium]|nr:hypothetical protein [Lachnospiraceae bacterium]
MDDLRKEIRDSLLGRLRIEEGAFVVARKGLMQFQFGMQDGFGSVLIFGLQCRMMWYRIPGKRKDAENRLDAALSSMGRKLVLSSAPKLKAVYCISITGQPVVLTVHMGEKDIEAFAYSGKGLTGALSTKHVISKFEKSMPEAMNPLPEEKIRERRQEAKNKLKSPRKLRREQKAAEKKALMAQKKENRKNGSIFATVASLLAKKKTEPASKPPAKEEVNPKAHAPEELVTEKTVIENTLIETAVTKSPVTDELNTDQQNATNTNNKKNKKKKKRKH